MFAAASHHHDSAVRSAADTGERKPLWRGAATLWPRATLGAFLIRDGGSTAGARIPIPLGQVRRVLDEAREVLQRAPLLQPPAFRRAQLCHFAIKIHLLGLRRAAQRRRSGEGARCVCARAAGDEEAEGRAETRARDPWRRVVRMCACAAADSRSAAWSAAHTWTTSFESELALPCSASIEALVVLRERPARFLPSSVISPAHAPGFDRRGRWWGST